MTTPMQRAGSESSGAPASAPPGRNASGTLAIQGMYFLSGMGALVFENVWFRQTGLIVGNSVWSAALVVGAFMGGLALGNVAAVVLAQRWGNLVRGYALLEAVAAVSGAAVVLAFPHLPAVFRPLLAPFLDDAATLNAIRLGIAFGLMVIPATALGATLPLLSKPLEAVTGNYGYALGRLYGVNTLGAVAGTLLAELALVPWLGLLGSGLFAAACNLTAALVALQIGGQPRFHGSRSAPRSARTLFTADGARVAAAAFLAGGVLLALEVIWFRFLLLLHNGTSLMFATMLAVVLAGIGLGGMAASWWSRRGWSPGRAARLAAAGGAVGVVASYAGFYGFSEMLAGLRTEYVLLSVLLSVFLMGPVCVLSGVLFTALGDALRGRMTDAAAATGALTVVNTLGAMAGSLLAAFVLLPEYGMERSFFFLAALYGVILLTVPERGATWSWRIAPPVAAGMVLALFPFGMMTDIHHRRVEAHYGARLVTAREGVSETVFYLAHGFGGETQYHRLATNAYSMSTTSNPAQRYMRLFAYLPAALHPRIERALLICFGVGSTASAITDLPDVRSIDVVDVSRDILEMSDIAHPDARRHPLRDSRAVVHVEDGRFFLQQTDKGYDLITGEPPPPKLAGVASLYTREHFQLLHDHLNPGGLVTYWLPINQLRQDDTLAIIRAFCDVFEDCSLWSGVGGQWLLMGSRGGIAAVSRDRFSRLWTLPETSRQLRVIGIDTPEQLVGQFMADAKVLRELTSRVLPLVDNFPQRLSSTPATGRIEPLYAWLMNADGSRERLEASPWIAEMLPRSLVTQSTGRFRQREMLHAVWYPELRRPDYNLWNDLAELIRTDQVTQLMWMLGSDPRMAEIAGRRDPGNAATAPVIAEHTAINALANRRKPVKVTQKRFLSMTPVGQVVTIFHHCVAGERAAARSLMAWIPQERRVQEPYHAFLSWADTECKVTRR